LLPSKLKTFLLALTALYPHGYINKIRLPLLVWKSLSDLHSTELFEIDKIGDRCARFLNIMKVENGEEQKTNLLFASPPEGTYATATRPPYVMEQWLWTEQQLHWSMIDDVKHHHTYDQPAGVNMQAVH